MKLPRLPRKCSVLEAKYSAQQMRDYGEACIKEHMKQIPTLIRVAPPEEKSIVEKMKELW